MWQLSVESEVNAYVHLFLSTLLARASGKRKPKGNWLMPIPLGSAVKMEMVILRLAVVVQLENSSLELLTVCQVGR